MKIEHWYIYKVKAKTHPYLLIGGILEEDIELHPFLVHFHSDHILSPWNGLRLIKIFDDEDKAGRTLDALNKAHEIL